MADFRQFALEFVLSDDEAKKTSLAQQTASELKNAPVNGKPVARWVESVQPWMPGANGDEAMGDSDETPDWTARSKALEYLSRTLDFLEKDVLAKSQVQLLISFFGAMFDIDHKAGIMASATALNSIVRMKNFQPISASNIIRGICALQDDFARQVSKTRLEVYKLLQYLITTPKITEALKSGKTETWLKGLLNLCRAERDPDCLMVWFSIQAFYMTTYNPSQEMAEEIYNVFKAYFPITLPRASQTGLTPEDLKLALRSCFSSNYRVAHLAFPFLLSKMDQGEGVTVNVKVDVLRTIKACLESYEQPQESVHPYVNQVWGSLKYEVRNGEIEDTIWATLEVLKTLATRLEGEELRDYALTVTRDCVSDLTDAQYTAPAGRLLISVLSANPTAFVLIVAPAITHIKENLRHPKTPSHSQDLMKLLHVILETRLLLSSLSMQPQEQSDFAAVDGVFKPLWGDVYERALKPAYESTEPTFEEVKLATEAVQGAGALVCQHIVTPGTSTTETARLLSDETSQTITTTLFNIFKWHTVTDVRSDKGATDELLNELSRALQRSLLIFDKGFTPFVIEARSSIAALAKGSADSEKIQSLSLLLAFAGCSELPLDFSRGISSFLYLIRSLYEELMEGINGGVKPKVWCALVAGIQSAVRHFSDACLQKLGDSADERSWDSSWAAAIVTKYPELEPIGSESASVKISNVAELRTDALLIGLFYVRQLYQRATTTTEDESKPLDLSADFAGSDKASETQYLHLISDLAGYVIHEMGETRQKDIEAEKLAFSLFADSISEQNSQQLAFGRLNILCLGILEGLHPTVVKQLFDDGVAQRVILTGVSDLSTEPSTRPVARSILTILANKHKFEAFEPLMTALNAQCELIAIQYWSIDRVSSIFAIMAGMVRRAYSSERAYSLLNYFRQAPKSTNMGVQRARALEMVVAPQRYLDKKNFAIVKPLWTQKAYIELVQPLLSAATNPDNNVVIKTNYSFALLLMTKHIPFAIYEDDADKILRVAISVAQTLPTSPDTLAALTVLRDILIESSEKGEPHIHSIIGICIGTFSPDPSARIPEWLPDNYIAPLSQETSSACGKLALELIGALTKMFEPRHLVPHTNLVQRKLMTACGLGVRDLRRTARIARSAWADLK